MSSFPLPLLEPVVIARQRAVKSSISAHLFELAYNDPNSATLGLLVSIMYVGGVISVPMSPYIPDIWGRRLGVVIGCVTMLVGVALVPIGYHVELFIIGRLILGLGLGIAQVS